jgi:hypothetical protein
MASFILHIYWPPTIIGSIDPLWIVYSYLHFATLNRREPGATDKLGLKAIEEARGM